MLVRVKAIGASIVAGVAEVFGETGMIAFPSGYRSKDKDKSDYRGVSD